MGKFRQISTELWPLIDVRNSFLFSIFGISLSIFFKLCMRVDIGEECFKLCQITITELHPLIYLQNCVLLNIF